MKPSSVRQISVAIAAFGLFCGLPSMVKGQGGPPSEAFPGFSALMDPSIKATFVHLGDHVPGLLYEPITPGEKSSIGILVMHSGGDYLNFPACTEMSKRGYRVLCANVGSVFDTIEKKLLDVKLGVAYLRKYPGIRQVILWGHSGGGTLMSAYQDIAENGLRACQGPEKIYRCSDKVAGLPPADGLMLIDANFGDGAMVLMSLDPAVVEEEDGQTLNPELNQFNPQNGFNPAGSTYSEEFIHKFQKAEGKRESQLIKTALDRLTLINSGKGHFADDEPFIVSGGNGTSPGNKLFPQDIRLMSHTRKAWPLLRPDGSTVTQVVHSVRVPQFPTSPTPLYEGGAIPTTVRNFLGTYAIRVTDDFGYDEKSVHGIDWTSTISSPPGDVEGVTVPLLTMGMTGSWEFMAAETIYENAKSSDKSLAYVEGASHGYQTCHECEKYPGQFGDTQKTTFDYVDSWLSEKGRYIPEGK